MKDKRIVVVLGMHRSGTSVTTRALKVLGINLGDKLMPPVIGVNDKGFWEDLDINKLNIELLKDIGRDWHDVSLLRDTEVSHIKVEKNIAKASQMLREKIDGHEMFGIKDPRISVLLPFWKEVFSRCGLDVSYVLSIRHPSCVAFSLQKRDHIDFHKSYLLWLGYTISVLKNTIDENLVVVDYDQLMDSPDSEVRRLSKLLCIDIDEEKLSLYVNDFIDSGLRHAVGNLEELSNNNLCPAIVNEIYKKLLEWSSQEDNQLLRDIRNDIEGWWQEYIRFQPQLIYLDFLSSELHRNSAEIGRLVELVEVKDREIDRLKSEVQDLIKQKDSANREKEKYALWTEELRRQKDVLLCSSSWRLTLPLRYVGTRVISARRLVDALMYSYKLDNGIVGTTKKVISVYRKEGFSGVRRRANLRGYIAQNTQARQTDVGIFSKTNEKMVPGEWCIDGNAINYFGYIKAQSGLGTACRGYISALRAYDEEVVPVNVNCGLKEVDFEVSAEPKEKVKCNIVHMNADSIDYFFSQVERRVLDGHYNIGIWVWELAAFRPDWFDSFRHFNEIWTPSEFCKRSISAISPIPVHVVPHVVKRDVLTIDDPKGYFGLPRDSFIFGFMFDCSSSIERKNPFCVIDAFNRTFGERDDVRLLLKFSNGKYDPRLYEELCRRISLNRNIITLERSLKKEEVQWFFDAIDSYVSPHRSEGFGLTVAEAMLSGKPVIATNYGGVTEFLKMDIAYPIDYKLIPISEQIGPYLQNYLWAEPDLEHFCSRMREVYESPDVAMKKGKNARQYIEGKFSESCIGKIINDRLSSIFSDNENVMDLS